MDARLLYHMPWIDFLSSQFFNGLWRLVLWGISSRIVWNVPFHVTVVWNGVHWLLLSVSFHDRARWTRWLVILRALRLERWWQAHSISIFGVQQVLIDANRVVRVPSHILVHIIISWMTVAAPVQFHLLEMRLDLLLLCFTEKFKLLHDILPVIVELFAHAPVRFHVNVLLD